jgi:Protein of unknown function (DUF3572)
MKQSRRPTADKTDLKAKDAAVALAIDALGFIAGEPEQLGRFLALSGIGPDSLRAAAREPNFLLGVLDYVAGDEALLVAFAGHSGIDPAEVARARDVLAGETPEVP